MTKTSPPPLPIVGLVRLREHCAFTWRRSEGQVQSSLEIREHHCLQCIAEARRRDYKLVYPDGKDYPA